MLYLVDSANVSFIQRMMDTYDIVGVTTNPTIIAKESANYHDLLQDIINVLKGKILHVQLNSTNYVDMIIEAKNLVEQFGKELHIKIPVSKDGFKAISYLSKNGYHVTATAICNVNQGVMAALHGAEYLAVYVNRISDSGMDGNGIVQDIKIILDRLHLNSKIIGASYKSVFQVTDSILSGADQVTVGMDLFEKLFHSDITNQSIVQFTKDFKNSK